MYITIIEDEKILSSNIAKKLIRNWFNTKIYNSYNEFINYSNNKSDLYIIDISLRDKKNWFDIIKYLREKKKIDSPIIIISGYSDIEKKLYWLDIWADDYLVKPFSSDELIARIRALIRRSFKATNNSKISYNNLIYNASDKIILKKGKVVNLRAREIQFVEFLLFNIGQLVTKTQIINSVWWEDDILKISDNNLDVTVSNIRRKLWKEFKLRTIINKWYILEK